ncbi:MAG: KEOPS complex subunit Pcc1 [Methanosphaera sp.]|nr:KEOPS complex subunit Pcc1 [Methanosphaera sp.]
MSGIVEKIETEFIVEFDSDSDASIVYNSILPEIEAETNQRSRTVMSLDSNRIIISITSGDVVSLRASINSYVRWISLSEKILKI